MSEFEILFTIMIGGLGLQLSLMLIIWNSLNNRIDKLSEKVEDIDRRLCRIEGSLASQGHCLFTKSQSDHKAL